MRENAVSYDWDGVRYVKTYPKKSETCSLTDTQRKWLSSLDVDDMWGYDCQIDDILKKGYYTPYDKAIIECVIDIYKKNHGKQ